MNNICQIIWYFLYHLTEYYHGELVAWFARPHAAMNCHAVWATSWASAQLLLKNASQIVDNDANPATHYYSVGQILGK